ncbi:unnamed protein product [Acanthoscelides obtectus]|uniref:C2H2-type domain-containing protein n=2 Tax=Acanthoscelides obtectus TaxID=200917 RepID=A0A9P0KQ79_ACAOB|nr:unnamed protein product [Acanthoscelides obtectus]CAK1664432.1 Zinc finger protein 354C [Acanthoscelides obtectus]
MDQPISSADGDIQYVLNNSSQFILEPSDPEKLGNVFYTDGTQAIFVDGGLIADSTDGDGQTYVLQDCDLNQYYIPETGDIFLSEEDQSSSGFLETVPSQLETDESTSSNQLVQIIVEDQVVDLEDFIQQGDAAVVQIAGEENRYQYAVLKDGKLHIQSYPEIGDSQDLVQVADEAPSTEWDKITGRNLITGKQLSLRSLAENRQKKVLTKRKRKNKNGLLGLLNKKLELGQTVDGKKLFLKIIHIGNKPDVSIEKPADQKSDQSNQVTCSPKDTYSVNSVKTENNEEDTCNLEFQSTNYVLPTSTINEIVSTPTNTAFIIKRKFVSKEVLDQISKTLSGLMKLESVKKKLKNKLLLVKVVEERYVQSKKGFDKNCSYSCGCIVDEYLVDQETGDLVQNWTYIAEENKEPEENTNGEADRKTQLLEVLQLTLLITYQKKGPHVKVILDPHGTLLQCLKCNKSFKTKGLLYAHLASEHGVNVATKQCGNCSFTATSDSEWEEHRKYHEGQQVLGCVEEGCDAYFSTLINLSKHAEVHKKNNNNKKYSLSSKQLSSLYLAEDLNGTTKKSQESKQGKIFQCKSCKRIFSRYSNLMRHAEIHTGQDMYRCSICGSTYHYASSLTRHMVQNHIKA